MIAMALPVLPVTTSLRLGEYSANRGGRRWLFLAAKIALVVPIVFFGALAFAPILPLPVLPNCMIVGNLVAFRWVLTDQRRRCPECLRLLAHPATIGRPAHTVLEWYGTEFACTKGHGLLHVREDVSISFHSQRWLHLDRSWRALFS
jgi:hypothetical protein